jgi:uncharacterized 2Fe-2S/4Fe-4S cluster protein (DUF4445 family)
MPRIRFEPTGFTADSREGENLAEIAERAGVPLETVCGGQGTCASCKVFLRRGEAPVTEKDRKQISKEEIELGARLACQLFPEEDLVVHVPAGSTKGKQTILVDSDIEICLDSVVRSCTIGVPRASLEYQIGDLERLVSEVCGHEGKPYSISVDRLNSLGELIREGREVNVVLRDNEILDIAPSESDGCYGVAVDIGTTTVVSYLMDFLAGRTLAVSSVMNPQIRHGNDVLSRMTFAMRDKEGRSILHSLIVGAIDELVGECCLKAGVERERIFEMVVVGNTAMHHMFFGLDTYGLGRAPYVPLVSQPLEVKAASLPIRLADESYVYSLPNVAGFIGADHVSVLLATRLWECERPTMVIDIGTNGEISIGDMRGVASTSCAAGPALEGGNISHGMRGASGAIDHVLISDELEVTHTTINGGRARGICGSAVVDSIAEMFRTGMIDSKGRLDRDLDHPRIREINGVVQMVIADDDESATGGVISLTQKDIGEVLNAKAAMFVGAITLMEEMNIDVSELDRIFLAGAFGNYISPRSAMTLGMIPEVPLERIISVGNAAGSGAKVALLNGRSREEARTMARELRYVELAARSDFQEKYFKALFIPHMDGSNFPRVMESVRRG